MIAGIGTDLCDTGRIARALARHGDAVCEKILGADEWLVYSDREAHARACLCDIWEPALPHKEAFSKAIGWAWFIPWGGILA